MPAALPSGVIILRPASGLTTGWGFLMSVRLSPTTSERFLLRRFHYLRTSACSHTSASEGVPPHAVPSPRLRPPRSAKGLHTPPPNYPGETGVGVTRPGGARNRVRHHAATLRPVGVDRQVRGVAGDRRTAVAPGQAFRRRARTLAYAREAANTFRVAYAVWRVRKGTPRLLKRYPSTHVRVRAWLQHGTEKRHPFQIRFFSTTCPPGHGELEARQRGRPRSIVVIDVSTEAHHFGCCNAALGPGRLNSKRPTKARPAHQDPGARRW
jgi:hypothetical protein